MRDVESNFTKKYNQMVRIQFKKKKKFKSHNKNIFLYYYF